MITTITQKNLRAAFAAIAALSRNKIIFTILILISGSSLIHQCSVMALEEDHGGSGGGGHLTRDELLRTNVKFAVDFYKHLVAPSGPNAESNVIMSPFSLATVLAMVLYGGRNTTRAQLSQVLFRRDLGDDSLASMGEIYGAHLTETLNDLERSLNLGNLGYAQLNYPILESFRTALEKNFLALFSSVDFSDNSTLELINGQVKDATHGKIPKLFDDPFDPLTRLVLVNAIHLKGLWKSPFKPENTEKEQFYPSGSVKSGDPVMVDMMYQSGRYRIGYCPELQCSSLLLPYNDSTMSMLVLLPDDGVKLAELERSLNVDSLSDLIHQMRSGKVEVRLPKFTIESRHDLIDQLKAMGATDMFSEANANFSGITSSSESIYVSVLLQKAVIEVNEEGTEAAAATGSVMVARSFVIPEEFRANRPFLFVILSRTPEEKMPPSREGKDSKDKKKRSRDDEDPIIPLFMGSLRKP